MFNWSLALCIFTSVCLPNPGSRTVKYPCNICKKTCTWSKKLRSVASTGCKRFHAKCLQMNTAVSRLFKEFDAYHISSSSPCNRLTNIINCILGQQSMIPPSLHLLQLKENQQPSARKFSKFSVSTFRVSKGAKIRNQYNQVQHLTQDTYGKVTNSKLDTTNESQEVNPFPAGDHKARVYAPRKNHSVVCKSTQALALILLVKLDPTFVE